MENIFFRTSDLSVGYNGKALIRDIEVALRKGEILTLIGPNGSGKSTILKSITKHLETIKGDSFIADASVKEASYKELSKKLAVVLTERIKGELLTCRDVVSTGRYPYTNTLGLLSAEDREKVEAAMERVHASELADRDFTAISDGQRQRVLLARAICQEPEIIVLDEPTSFLDIRHKIELLSILRSMAREKGITVIMSLHEIDLAQKISDKVMCVKGETIEHFGTPEEIFKEEIIDELYGLASSAEGSSEGAGNSGSGSYNVLFGSVELPRVEGEPKAFVISGGGSGIPLFRKLQKEEMPFACGVLCENDIDYPLARMLAVEVVAERPFEAISDEAFSRALSLIESCESVYYTAAAMGGTNARLAELVEAARKAGKLKEL